VRKKILFLISLMAILSFISCRGGRGVDLRGWNCGRYDLVSDFSSLEVDNFFVDLGLRSNRYFIESGWAKENETDPSGTTFVWATGKVSEIKFPPLTKKDRLIHLSAHGFCPPGISGQKVKLFFNRKFIGEAKLTKDFAHYSFPVKGRYIKDNEDNRLELIHRYAISPANILWMVADTREFAACYDSISLVDKKKNKDWEELPKSYLKYTAYIRRREAREVLALPPGGEFKLSLKLPDEEGIRLRFSPAVNGFFINNLNWARFLITISSNRGDEELFREERGRGEISKEWRVHQIDLTRYRGEKVVLRFKVEGEAKPGLPAEVGWANPHLIAGELKPKKRLNVILYLIDALRADHLGCYRHPYIKTPYIDKLAEEGVLFENAFVQCSWTRPSSATILTSLYPTTHGAITDHDILRPSITSLAETLRHYGYHTLGCINIPNVAPEIGFFQGFDRYLAAYKRPHFHPLLSDRMNGMVFPWFEELKDEPFFLYMHTVDPHAPYIPPPPYDRIYDPDYKGEIKGSTKILEKIRTGLLEITERDRKHLLALYGGEVTYNDKSVGELMKKLHELGIAENTLLIIIADHGEEFLEHGGTQHGSTLYKEVLHIPLIFHCPVELPQGKRVSQLVRTVDVLPTILDLLDIPEPERIEGKTLLPLIEKGKNPGIAYSFAELDLAKKQFRSLQNNRWKLIIHPYLQRKREFYNLKDDPGEKKNLFPYGKMPPAYSELSKKLAGILERQKKEARKFRRMKVEKLNKETLEQLKALGYIH
jgi:arylsulfatase A-like enzyme